MLKKTRWDIMETDADLKLMNRVLGVNEITARVMANRGIRSKKAALFYLRPDAALSGANVLDMKDATRAFGRITKGITNRERIIIYGDYDADGIMSTVILYKSLKLCGANVNFYIPHREEEGYGLNIDAVQSIKQGDYDLIITCDNGISAFDEVAEAGALGTDVIVIDHHEPGSVNGQDVIPEAFAVVDPKQKACPYPFKDLCAAGLSLLMMEEFFKCTNKDFLPLKNELTVLAAIATVCDIVDLTGENRTLVKNGLSILNDDKDVNEGLGRLIALKGYMEKPVDAFTLGFVIGPCINASGRLESAEMSVRLLLSEDITEQMALARTLSELNEERKALTRHCVERTLEVSEKSEDTVIILVDDKIHESIAGIVAGRIKEALYKPVIILTHGAEKGILKGSGRSVEGYNMFEALYAERELLHRFGGHAMAAGMSVPEENVQELRRALNERCNLTEEDLQNILHIDMELKQKEITLDLAGQLEWLAPFGKGNREPLFVTYCLPVTGLRIIGQKNTLIFNFNRLKGIAFGLNDVFLAEVQANYTEQEYRRIISGETGNLILDVVHSVESNTYNGNTTVQIRIKDFKIRR